MSDQIKGLLTRDLRIPLGAQLDFNARFGLAFSPSAQQLGGEEGGPRFVLPYAALDWRPGKGRRQARRASISMPSSAGNSTAPSSVSGPTALRRSAARCASTTAACGLSLGLVTPSSPRPTGTRG